jgi:hypothetical protein
MSIRKRVATVALATGMAFVPMIATTAGTAHADRCEPEELVLGPGTSPIDERDNPVCFVLVNYTYGFVCDDPTTLNTCLQSVNPDPSYRPNPVFYQPDPNRIYCNLYSFAVPGGSCTREADAPLPAAP